MKNYRIIKLTNISLSTICGIETNASINIWNNRKFISEYKWQIKDNLINGNFICHDEDYVQVPLDISLKEVDDMIQDIYRMTDVQEYNAKVGKVIINRFKEYAIKCNVDHTVSPLVFSKMQNVFDLLSAGMFLEAIDELTSLPNDNVLTTEIKTFYIELILSSNAIHTDIPIPIDPGIESVAGTYKQVEVDIYGRVKAGSNPVTNISDVNGLQDVLNGKVDDIDLDEYLPLIGGNLEGDLSIKSNTNSRLLGFIVPIDGYSSSSRNSMSFRHDKNELAHARLKGYTITETGSKIFGDSVDYFFNEKGTYNNLYDINNPNSDYSIEITPTNQFNNSANTAWRLIVSFHSGAVFSNLIVDIKNGVDIWTTVYNGYPNNTNVFMYDFTLTNGGAIKSVKFTFQNITGNTYINHIGIEGRLSNIESQWYVNRLGGDVYGDINAHNLLVNNKQVATQEWTTSQDYITKTISDSLYLESTLKGIPDGIAELDSTGRVPSNQLPSYVDDVVVVESYSSLPTTGENGKIYITIDSNLTYRWNGSGYTEISPSLALGETSSTAYRGDRGKVAYDHSQLITDNPHNVTVPQISGLQGQLDGKATLNTTLVDSAASTTLPYTASDTLVSKIQALRNNVKYILANLLALGETNTTAYRGDRGKVAYDHSQLITGNPHNVTVPQISGLQGQLDGKATLNTTLVDSAASTTLPYTASDTLVSKIQALRNNVKYIFNSLTSIYTKTETNNLLNAKAPTNHATTSTAYGSASTTNYGHVRLATSMADTYGVPNAALMENAIYLQGDRFWTGTLNAYWIRPGNTFATAGENVMFIGNAYDGDAVFDWRWLRENIVHHVYIRNNITTRKLLVYADGNYKVYLTEYDYSSIFVYSHPYSGNNNKAQSAIRCIRSGNTLYIMNY